MKFRANPPLKRAKTLATDHLKKNNDLNKTVELPQKVKIKEKIIIQKESKPETAEEGNNMQIFEQKKG